MMFHLYNCVIYYKFYLSDHFLVAVTCVLSLPCPCYSYSRFHTGHCAVDRILVAMAKVEFPRTWAPTFCQSCEKEGHSQVRRTQGKNAKCDLYQSFQPRPYQPCHSVNTYLTNIFKFSGEQKITQSTLDKNRGTMQINTNV